MQARRGKSLRKWAVLAGGRQGAPGGSEQYSPESLQRRYQIRQRPDVVRVLQDWWSAAQSSVQGGGDSSRVEQLSRDDYCAMCMRIYRAMLKKYDEDEARESAEADWEHDTRGAAGLGCDPFMDALFELADLWTGPSVEAAVYVSFLRTLLDRIAVAGGEHADPAGALGWRAAEEVRYGGDLLERGQQQGEEGEEGEEAGGAPVRGGGGGANEAESGGGGNAGGKGDGKVGGGSRLLEHLPLPMMEALRAARLDYEHPAPPATDLAGLARLAAAAAHARHDRLRLGALRALSGRDASLLLWQAAGPAPAPAPLPLPPPYHRRRRQP